MNETRWPLLVAWIVLCTLAISPLRADDKPHDLIVGKWEPVKPVKGVKTFIEFEKDGKVLINFSAEGQEFKLQATYKFTDDNTMQMQMDAGGKKESKKIKIVKLTRDEFVMKDEGKDEEEKFKRVK
jgi:uncharacterized protein (TIGR03066 family)